MIRRRKTGVRFAIAVIGAVLAPGGSAVEIHPVDTLEPGHWIEIDDTALDALNPCPGDDCSYSANLGLRSIMDSWSGGAFDTRRNRLLIWGGGHGGYAGNEIYAFDTDTLAWERLTEPSVDVGGEVSSGLYPDGLPRSRHSYGYLVYADNVDTLFSIGGAALYPTGGTGDSRVHGFSFTTGQWRSDYATPFGDAGNHFGAASYEPATGRIWYLGWRQAPLSEYDPVRDRWRQHASAPLDIDGMTAIDPKRRLLLLLGGYGNKRQIFVFDLEHPKKTPVKPDTSGDTSLEHKSKLGLAFDPVSDRFVAWDDGASVSTLNPETWAWRRVPPAVGNRVVPRRGMNGTYGRFRYVPNRNAFVLVNRTSDNVLFYRLGDETAAAGSPHTAALSPSNRTPGPNTSGQDETGAAPVSQGTESAEKKPSPLPPAQAPDWERLIDAEPATWEERTRAPGVLMSTRFDTREEVTAWLAGRGRDHVTWDTGRKASGAGSMRFAILATDGASSGNWARWLADDQRQFGPGDAFFVQFRQYVPAYLATHRFEGGGGWKQIIVSRRASSMNGVRQSRPYGSNQLNELVLQNTFHRGIVQGYNRNSAGRYPPWEVPARTACSRTDFRFQNAVDRGPQRRGSRCERDRARYGGLYSYYQQKPEGFMPGHPDPISGGFAYYPDEWLTFLLYVRPGRFGGESNDAYVALLAARDGERYRLLIERDDIDLGAGPPLDTLWLLPYNTGRKPDPSRQDTFTNYDEVIVSVEPVPVPR